MLEVIFGGLRLEGFHPLEVYLPSFSSVKKWLVELKRGCSSICDDESSGRSKNVTANENIKKKLAMSVKRSTRENM